MSLIYADINSRKDGRRQVNLATASAYTLRTFKRSLIIYNDHCNWQAPVGIYRLETAGFAWIAELSY